MEKGLATFGNGCFWCTEAIFKGIVGVMEVTSGYSGGTTINPDYKSVCTGQTGHAECLQIQYDPTKISFEQLLEVFWATHDPTTLNRQGNDIGTQYRSVIFYHNESQKEIAHEYVAQLTSNKTFSNPIVTIIEPISIFYSAENYHQDYFSQHQNESYCQFVVRPKVEKFRKEFKSRLAEK